MEKPRYRVWDQLKKTMWQPANVSSFDFDSECAWIKQPNKGGHWVYFKNAVLLESTGHRDKNWVEIHRGDVVRAFNKSYDDVPRDNEVVLSLGCFKLRCIAPVNSDSPYFEDTFVSDIPIFNYSEVELEVIGNIYENPKLLNQ